MSAWAQIPLIVGGAFSYSQSPQTHRRLRAALGALGGVQGFAVAAHAQQVTHGCLPSDAWSSHPDFRSYVPLDGRHPPPAGTRLASAVVLVHVGQLEERLHHTPPSDNLTVMQLESKLTDADQSLLTTWCHAREVKRLSVSFPAANRASRPVSLRPRFLAYNNSLVELDLSHLGPLEEIGDWALCGCSSLATMHFPLEQLPAGMRIGSNVLEVATKLVTVINMPSLDEIETKGQCFMHGCRCITLKLNLATLESGFSPRVRRIYLSDITSLTSIGRLHVGSEEFEVSRLPSLTSIGDDFLYKNASLSVVELLDLPSLHSIGSRFVCTCSDLKTLNLSGLTALKRVGDSFISYNRLGSVDIRPLRETLDLACIGDAFLDSNVLELTVSTDDGSPSQSNVAALVKPLLQLPKPRHMLRAELGRMLTDDVQVLAAPSDGSYEDFDVFSRDVRTGAFAIVEALLRSECVKVVHHATDMSALEFCRLLYTDGSANDDDSELNDEARASLRHHIIALCKEVQKLFPADAGFLKYKAKSRQLQDRVRYYEGRVEAAEQEVADLTKQLDEEKARKRGGKSRRADTKEPRNGGSPQHQARHGQPRAGKGR